MLHTQTRFALAQASFLLVQRTKQAQVFDLNCAHLLETQASRHLEQETFFLRETRLEEEVVSLGLERATSLVPTQEIVASSAEASSSL